MGYSPWGHKKSDTTEQLHFPKASSPNAITLRIKASAYELEGWMRRGWVGRKEKMTQSLSSVQSLSRVRLFVTA